MAMDRKKKRALVAGGALVAVGAIGLGIYFWSKKVGVAPAPLPAPSGGGALPPPAPMPTPPSGGGDQNIPATNQNNTQPLPAASAGGGGDQNTPAGDMNISG